MLTARKHPSDVDPSSQLLSLLHVDCAADQFIPSAQNDLESMFWCDTRSSGCPIRAAFDPESFSNQGTDTSP